MKILASTDKVLLRSNDGMFELVADRGVGTSNTPWSGLDVISKGLADKHIVSITLNSNYAKFNGEPIKFSYKGLHISHGMRSAVDTIEETLEYIEVLESAVDFANVVEEYMAENGWLVD